MKNMNGSGSEGGSTPTNTPDNLFSEDVIEVVLALSEGPIRGLQKGAQSFNVGETPLVAPDGITKNFEKFAIGVHPGFPEGAATSIDYHLGGTTSSFAVGVQLFQNISVTRQTDAVLRGVIDQLELRILFSRLLVTNDKGSFGATARFTVEYKLTTESTWHDFYPDHIVEITGKTSGGYVREFRVDVDRQSSADYQIRVTKLNVDTSTTEFVDMSWDSFQITTKGAVAYPDTALVHLIGVATGQFSSLPDFSGIYDGRLLSIPSNYNGDLRTYDESTPWNGTFKQAWSNNPAWVLYDLIMNTRYGLAAFRPYINTDRYSFYALAKWCDQPVLGGAPRYTFNDIIQEPRSASEQIQYVAGSCNALCLDDNNGTISLFVDKDDPAVMLFTPESVVDSGSGGFEYSFTDITSRANDITVTFINPDLNWNEDQRRITDITTSEANIAKFGRIPLDFIAVGCTNAEEAVRKAAVRLVSSLTEVTMLAFTTTRQGSHLALFDVILISDPTMGWAISGRVQSYDDNFMYFRDAIYIEEIKDYDVKVQTLTGVVNVGVHPESIGFVTRLQLREPFPTNIAKLAVFTLEEIGGYGLGKPFRVMNLEEDSESNGYLYRVSAIEINRNKYRDADNLLDLPEYQYSFKDPSIVAKPSDFTLSSGDDELLLLPTGEVVCRISATWVRPPRAQIVAFEVQWKVSSEGAWSESLRIVGEQVYLSPVVSDLFYDVRVRSLAPFAGSSPWVTISNYLVIGKTQRPPAVASFVLSVKADGTRSFVFSTVGQPPDVRSGGGYRIKYRPAQTTLPWESMTPLHDGLLVTSPYETNTPRDGIYDFAISSVDSSGNESTIAILINDFIVGNADFIDAVNGTGTNAEAMNQLIAELNAKIAANKAATAQLAIDAAVIELTNISSDDVLSRSEKSTVLQDYNTIIGEKTGLDAQADTFIISRVAYDNSVAALTTYLGTLTPAWNELTSDTVIVGSDFRAAFINVYTARQLMQNNIALKAKTLADAAGVNAAAAQTSANTALTNAANAQTSATAANTELANIASDSILSKGEKPAVALDYSNIINEQAGIDSQADTLSISRTAYDTYVSALTTYLTGLSPAYDSNTTDTSINPATFKAAFSNLYLARQQLLNAIAAKLKLIADNAATTAAAANALASSANSTANSAYSQASAANIELANIASDNILSKGEKPAVTLDYTAITNEWTGIATQANSLGVNHATYDAYVTAIQNYMEALSPRYDSYTTDTSINGATFKATFQNVYLSRQLVLNAIAAKAATLATWTGVSGTTGAIDTTHITPGAATAVLYFSFADQSVLNSAKHYCYPANPTSGSVGMVFTASAFVSGLNFNAPGPAALSYNIQVIEKRSSDNSTVTFNPPRVFWIYPTVSGVGASILVEEFFPCGVNNYLECGFAVLAAGGTGSGAGDTTSGTVTLTTTKVEIIKR